MLNKETELKKYCMSCIYFVPINERMGYCTMLGVGIKSGVVILDPLSILIDSGIDESADIYSHLIVQSLFGCICYKRMAMM